MARDSFATFIPLSLDSDSRTKIVFDFFDILSAIAAHGKNNGLGGRKLSRLAGWWAFEHVDTGAGFDGGYKGWSAYVFGERILAFGRDRRLTIRIDAPMLPATCSSHTFDHYLQTRSEGSTASQLFQCPYRSSSRRRNIHRKDQHLCRREHKRL